MRRAIYVVATLTMMIVASVGFAQPGPGGPGNGGPGNGGPGQPGMMAPGGGLIEYLGLDDAQIETWNAYHDEFRATVEPLHETMQDLHVQLRDALDADAPDASAVGQLMLDIEGVRDQIFAAREVLEQNLKSILTAEQLLKFEAFRAAQGQMRRGGGGPGRGPGAGSGMGPGCGSGTGTCDGPCS